MKFLNLFFLILIISFNSFSQNYMSKFENYDELMDEIMIQNTNQEINYTEVYDNLFQYYQNPFNINIASEEQLNSLFFLSQVQIKNIINHRINLGDLVSIYELQQVDSLNINTIKILAHFIKFETSKHFDINEIHDKSTQNILLRFGLKNDTSSSTFLRYKYSSANNLSFGFTAKQDAGEKYIWNPAKQSLLFDFTSFHLSIQNKGKLKSLILGDYKLQFGQNLLFSSGFNIDKSSEAIASVRKNNLGARPYLSSIESGFFRGIASTITTSKNTSFTSFISYKKIDANIDSNKNISSIYNEGYHITASEVENKASAKELSYGGNFQYKYKELQLGINAIQTSYNLPVQKSNLHYNQFAFNGRDNFVSSAYFSYNWNNINTFGEVGVSQFKGKGIVLGGIIALSSKLDLAILYRKYDKDFHSFYGNSFGEASTNTNETGTYLGLKYKFSHKLVASAYVDRFESNWLTFQAIAPSKGYDYLCKLAYSPQKNIQINIQHRFEQKQKNSSSNNEPIHSLSNIKRQNTSFTFTFAPEKPWQFKTGFITSNYDFEEMNSKGKLLYQDIQFKSQKFSITARTTQYQTDDYDSRIYVHESDLPSSFTMPANFGKGMRNYIIINLKIANSFSLITKIIQTKQQGIEPKKSTELRFGLFGTF